MIWAHLRAFVWLRGRLAINQIERSGPLGALFAMVLTILLTAGAGIGLLAGVAIGYFGLATASPGQVMAVWDGAIVGFLIFWTIGLLSDFQRGDVLSLDRFLHLPVSPSGAFFINFAASSVGLSLIIFLPGMMGLALGIVLSRGPGMLPLLPLVAAFFLMVTAATYQFRGWLASLMVNARRRRMMVAAAPLLMILAVQLPTIIRQIGSSGPAPRVYPSAAEREENRARSRAAARRFNLVAPPGWLAYGAEAAAEGRPWPVLAAFVGMMLIGAASLRRAYGTTIRLYTGDFERRRRASPRTVAIVEAPRTGSQRRSAFMELRVPGVSEQVSAIAAAGLRSWMRAPELKLMLLSPAILLVVFSRMFTAQPEMPELLRTLAAAGLVGFMLILSFVGPVGNQFGFDRAGFRAFVLSPVPRRDVLLAKNLAALPYALVVTLCIVAVAQWLRPLRLDHLLGVLVQAISVFLIVCACANLLSIVGPMTLRAGSGMPVPHQGVRSLYPLAFLILTSVPVGLTLLPLGIEALLGAIGSWSEFPAFLVLGLVQTPLVGWLYSRALDSQGVLLQRREQQILDVVASRGN